MAAWPECRFTWIIGATEAKLLDDIPGIEFVVLDKSRGWRGMRAVWRTLAERRFDLLLHMHASMRANLASLGVKSGLRVGFDRARAKDYQWLFSNCRLPATPRQHVMDGLFEFAELLGLKDRLLRWDIPLSAEDREFAQHQIGNRPCLVISPCSSQRFRNFRNWDVANYAQVADFVGEHYGAKVVLTGGGTGLERRYGEEIAAGMQADPVNLIGRTTLKQLLAILDRATVVLCPDSGPAHMANTVRTPVVGLYATSNTCRTGPYFYQSLVVDKYPLAVAKEFGKRVQDIPWGHRVRSPDAMGLIKVDDVAEKLRQVFSGVVGQSSNLR